MITRKILGTLILVMPGFVVSLIFGRIKKSSGSANGPTNELLLGFQVSCPTSSVLLMGINNRGDNGDYS